MTKQLDDKLRDILTYTDKQRLPDDIIEADIAQLKQAFADEGYVKIPEPVQDMWEEYNRLAGFMTGQEWLERFTREYNELRRGGEPVTDYEDALEAAKRASGIKDE